MIVIITLSGCSTKGILDKNEQIRPAESSSHLFSKEPSDKALFEEALSFLRNQDKEQNYTEAKSRLQNLVTEFPDSKWMPGASALLVTLNNIAALQAELKREKLKTQGDQVRLTKEIRDLKDNVKQAEEKYSVEVNRLQQENEQLKKDIQQLKNLEIHLEKREKMLR